MNSTLQTINSLHNLNIKKEDFNSFKNVKQYFDKFLKIILMDSPILVSKLKSADKYVNENGVYPYEKSYYETFKLSDDGYDSPDAIILARYCKLLRYILEKIDSNSKIKFNLMDIIEPKFTRLVSFLSKLSIFANFMLTIDDNVKQIIKNCEKEKRKNDKVISNIKLREEQLLQNNYNYDELNEYFQAINENLKSSKLELNKTKEIIKDKIAKTENLKAKRIELQQTLSELKEKTSKIIAEKNKVQKYIARKPEELDEEIYQLRTEYRRESEKLQYLFDSRAHFKQIAKRTPILSSTINLYSDHLSFINQGIENYDNFLHEKLKMQRPEIEINSHLLKTNENLNREINANKEKYFSQVDEIDNSKMENIRAQEHIADLEEQLKILKLNKEENLEEINKYRKEMKETVENIKKSEQQYFEKQKSIEENFNEIIKELKKL